MSLLPDWLTGYDSANADKAAAADAQLKNLALAEYGPGGKYYSAANLAAVNRDYLNQATFGVDNQRAAIDTAFTDSLATSADSIVGKPLGIVWAWIKSIFGALPWWVWLGAILGAVWYFGGFNWLKKKLA